MFVVVLVVGFFEDVFDFSGDDFGEFVDVLWFEDAADIIGSEFFEMGL